MKLPEGTWIDLTPAQADGLACVVCGRDYLDRTEDTAFGSAAVRLPVGRSRNGSQVFACTEPTDCAGTALADLPPR